MASVRSIIKEAVTRINLTPRRQAISGDILETAFQLLKGIVSKYNYDNLLSFTQNSVIVKNTMFTHIYDEDDFLAGKNNKYFETVEEMNAYVPNEQDMEDDVWAMVKGIDNAVYIVSQIGNDYVWYGMPIHDEFNPRIQQMKLYMACNHVQIRDVAKINSVYIITDANEPYKLHYELKFVPAYAFDNYTNDANVYTVTEKSEGEWLMQIKPKAVNLYGKRIKINYNEAIDFDIDSDLYIPDNYTELLIVALAHKLALQFPRLDDAQMQRLQLEVQTLVDNVRTPKAINRMVIRESYDYMNDYHTMTQNELLTGPLF